MRFAKTAALVAALAAAVLLVASPAPAQVNSNAATVNLNAVLSESLTVVATPGTVNFTLAGTGTANGDSAISITTTWILGATRTSVALHAYFSSATAALSNGTSNIASAKVSGTVNSGAYVPFTLASPFAAASSIPIFTQVITPLNLNSSRNDSLSLRIDTNGLSLSAGTYTGVLTIQAQAL